MYRILTLNKIADTALAQLPPKEYQVSGDEKNPHGVLVRSYDMHQMELPADLLAIARAGAGTNNIPAAQCAEQGVVVFNTPGGNANAVKELVIAGVLLASRKISAGIQWAQGLHGQEGVAALVEKGKNQFAGPEIAGKKMGVIGLGAVGLLVANACESLGMEVYGFDAFHSVEFAWRLSPGVKKAAGVEAIFAECDYVSIHVPLNNDTRYMVNDQLLDAAKPGIRIINYSRADLVDNNAIKKAVANGKVACYVTDFPTEDVLGCDGILPIPHLGASTPESEDNCAEMAAKQLRDYLAHGNIVNSVNFPACEYPMGSGRRVCVFHKDVADVAGVLTKAAADNGTQAVQVMARNRGAFGYAIMDIAGSDASGIEKTLKEVPGVLRVRVL